MRAVLQTISGAFLAAMMLAPVAGCGKPTATPTGPAGTNTLVTLGDMVLIPSGPFAMGNCMKPVKPTIAERVKAFVKRQPQPSFLDVNPGELPVHTVMVSSFYIDRYEVTKQLWDDVYTWAVSNGYAFDNPGEGKAPNHPVQMVLWWDCVKWCNARSEKEGLSPCYYTDAPKTEVYRTGRPNLDNEYVNWSTNGYRLPTEAEWEKAARGGFAGRRFPWGNTISHEQANYNSCLPIRYDFSRGRGLHPAFISGGMPFTSPVGSFAPNAYGLYDMTGNVCEWCWDWYDSVWYRTPGATQGDPHGPATGDQRVLRGGSYRLPANLVRCATRDQIYEMDTPINSKGFRCVRGL